MERSEELEMFRDLMAWCKKYNAVIYNDNDSSNVWICAGNQHYRTLMVTKDSLHHCDRVTFAKVEP